ncbi:unnamed protein product [Rotaria socialis]|uniref:Peptidase A2 domain-containing protein n=1 Tax=Rotaria socialis TaxID=392032 RepID=A0A821GUL3_9BILA|nr:unnamed protein product [Rotaria socialis]
MNSLSESARTTHAFLKITKDEPELQDENVPEPQQQHLNNKQHQAIVDTGSAVTLINQQLLKKIYHTELVYKKKLHKSANCTSIDIISEIQLEVKIQGHKTLIIADIAMNLITHLLLGNDWIMQNNVIIDSLQRHLALIDNISTNTF